MNQMMQGGNRTRSRRPLRQVDVDKIAELDAVRNAYFGRDPDRPDASFGRRSRERVPPEVKRAKGRLRSAHWRDKLDKLRRPTVRDVGMALAHALATTSDFSKMTRADYDLLRRAILNLQARGFSDAETRKVMRKLRNDMVDPADRAEEPGEGCAAPIMPKGWEDKELPF